MVQARTVLIQIKLQVLSKIVSIIRKQHNYKPKTNLWHREEEPHNHHETPGRQTKQSNQFPLHNHGDCKARMDIKPGLKGPPPPTEQPDTKLDFTLLVSNSLIQIGLAFQAFVRPSVYSQIGYLFASFFILPGKHMAKYGIHIMESIPGVLGNRENDIYPRGTGNKGQILSGTGYKGNIG